MADWIAEPDFTFEKVDTLSDGVLRLHFRYTGTKYACTSGWLDVDFSRKGVILGYEFNLKSRSSQGKETGQYDYTAIDGTPILKRRSIDRNQTLANSTVVKSRELDEYETELKAPPEEEFYLSFYGIPEPPGVQLQKPMPVYLWLLIGAVTCLTVGIGLRYVVRKGGQ